jgi:hypothetical protein
MLFTAVDRFPSLERERTESSERRSAAPKHQDPNHTREVIFALPSLQLHLKTEHLQSARTPDVTGNSICIAFGDRELMIMEKVITYWLCPSVC